MMHNYLYFKSQVIVIKRRLKPRTVIELKRYKLKMRGKDIPNNINKFTKRRERNKTKKVNYINKNKRRSMKYDRIYLKE